MVWKGVIKEYREYLPVTDRTPVVTLNEGNTPLIKARNLTKALGAGLEIHLKFEGLNPTNSFKDRGMTVAVSLALEANSKAVMCASTGNTSASAAAYAARAGLRCIILIPQGAIALGKLAQALVHGAKVLAIEGNFDEALNLVRKITSRHPIALVNSLNPHRIEGQKTAAFEIIDVLGDAPDYQFMPVGNAGNITAYWKGYKEYHRKGKAKKLPRMMGFQAEGAAPIVRGYPIENPETVATAIRIGNPASWERAEAARDESGGIIDTVSDEKIIEAYKMLANLEGIFVEPAAAASIAGLIKWSKTSKTENRKPKTVVCILTGHGLKDPDRAIAVVKEPVIVPARMESVLGEIGF
ncbi:threonine synthase [candidate division NPL-UPA2 bacterium]|nr:threonine synthase [candidate division NPL-UPA2 bacterium]